MFTIKIIGILMTISSSTAIGVYFSTLLKERISELKELKKNILLLQGDIRFGNTPLPEAIEAIANRHQGDFKKFFGQIADELSELGGITFYEVWKNAVDQCLTHTSLSKKDKLNLSKLGENLGHLDKQMQINHIDLYLNQLEEEIGEASDNLKEKSRLYNILGVMCGIFIIIVII